MPPKKVKKVKATKQKTKMMPMWATSSNTTGFGSFKNTGMKPGVNVPRQGLYSQSEKERMNMVNKDGYIIPQASADLLKVMDQFKYP